MTDLKTRTFWTPSIHPANGPVYIAIADALQADILSGAIRPGERLPPQRQLAQALGIDFTTVTRAYAEAARRGLAEGRIGQGTYVLPRRAQPQPEASGLIDMSMNMPPRLDNPALLSHLRNSIASLHTEDSDLLFSYQQPGGSLQDRTTGAHWLAARLGDVSAERVLVCAGAQGALLAITAMLAAPGDTICTDALLYPGFRSIAEYLRIGLDSVAMDDNGLIPESFEEICARRPPKALYCNPTLHNPTTATLSLERRQTLLTIAAKYDVPIIEDDAYGALPSSPVLTLAALSPSQVYHVAGLAKCLSPALRIAYLVAPDELAAERLKRIIRPTASMAAPLTAALATRWIEDGTAKAVLDGIRAEAKERQQIARDILGKADISTNPEAFHLWLKLPPGWQRGDFTSRLHSSGIGVVASDAFCLHDAPQAVRLGLGAPKNREALKQSLQTIADLLDKPPAQSQVVV